METKAKLAIVIATKNEENNIEKCLQSVTWTDEIIIIDDVSTDQTVEISKKYTDKIFINDSHSVFHINKNLGIDKATSEWILSLDADEIIPEELAEEIKQAIQNQAMLGYYLNRRNYFLGKWIKGCGWYPDYIIRLFRKGVTMWPTEVHNTPQITKKDQLGYLKNDFLHYSYTSFEQYFNKFNLYTMLMAKELNIKEEKVSLLYFPWDFIIKPLLVFIKKYFFQKGWKDGFYGFFISFSSALVQFVTYVKLWEIQKKSK